MEILHAVEMDNVTIQQDYALAIREIKGVIVLVILNYLTFMVFCIVLYIFDIHLSFFRVKLSCRLQ